MEVATAPDDVFCHGDDLSDNIVDDDAARSDDDPERLLLSSFWVLFSNLCCLA